MKRLKRFGSIATSTVIAFSTMMGMGFGSVVHATANTCTWTGATDSKFSTTTNWADCNSTSPVAGDVINLPYIDSATHTLTNDLSGNPALGGITIGNTSSTGGSTSYVIDTLHFADGATITSNTFGVSLGISDSVTADGSLLFIGGPRFSAISKDITVNFGNVTYQNVPATCAGGGVPDYTFTWAPSGVATVGNNSTYSLHGTESSVVVQTKGVLFLPSSITTYAGNISLAGGAGADTCGTPIDYQLAAYEDTTLSGDISLGGSTKYFVGDGKTLTVSGAISGAGFSLTNSSNDYSTGTFVNSSSSNNSDTPSGTNSVAVTTDPAITDDQPTTDLTVTPKHIMTLDGSRQTVSVSSGGVLKGTGTAKSLYVNAGGTVAPGHSPGKLTVLTTLGLDGTYQAELKNATAGNYDQLVVGNAADTSGHDVTLGDGTTLPTLTVSLYDGASIKAGDNFTIIDNLSKTDVSGTFKDLAEGATFKVNDGVFKITYKGGDGNDVVLTAVTAPKAPDTGFALVSSNPMVTLGAVVVVAGVLLGLARRSHKSTSRR
ncbi:MAG: hypothetical protein ABI220_05445 [Candidatus Saccharimonadales bacterium]